MLVTKQSAAQKLTAYLHHELSLAQLVDWAEIALLDGEFAEQDVEALRFVVSRLGVADVRAFGLTWEDCESLLDRLGYRARVEVFAWSFSAVSRRIRDHPACSRSPTSLFINRPASQFSLRAVTIVASQPT
jgi:hypothetical protein